MEFASERQFFHKNTYKLDNLCHLKAMLKAMHVKNKHRDPLFSCFILISYNKMILQAIIEKHKSQTQLHPYLLKVDLPSRVLTQGTTIVNPRLIMGL